MDFGLTGKVAAVTGGGRGIGRAICLALAQEEADIAVLDILTDEAAETARLVRGLGRRAAAVPVDVSSYDSVSAAFQRVVNDLGPVDVLVNCAALTDNVATIEKMSLEAWHREMTVNLYGAFYCIKQVGPAMRERGWGRVINISSRAGLDGGYGQAAYAASKAGLVGLTKTIALEYARHGVTCNVIFPSLANTPAVQKMPAEIKQRILRRIPTRRLQDPEEIGFAVAFLASEQAKSFNGAEIGITGGFELFTF